MKKKLVINMLDSLEGDPLVLPLTYLGNAPQDIGLLSSGDLLKYALVNLSAEGGYAV